MALMTIDGLTVKFGGIHALNDVNFNIKPGEVVGLIGPNGAGKSTLVNVLSGMCTPSSGRIAFGDKEVLSIAPHEIIKEGVARTFQNIQLFTSLTVCENILIGAHYSLKYGIVSSFFRTNSVRKDDSQAKEKADKILRMLGLEKRSESYAGLLSYAEQKLVELGRALLAEPKLLLLDEPMAGINAAAKGYFADLITRLHQESRWSMLIIEHDLDFISRLCSKVIVLNFGRKIFEGSPNEAKADAAVRAAYIG